MSHVRRALARAALGVALALAPPFAAASNAPLDQPDRAPGGVAARLSELPVLFIANRGQWHPDLRYRARAAGVEAFFTAERIAMEFAGDARPARLSLRPLGANASARIEPGAALVTRFNYFRGADPSRWHTDVPTHSGLRYRDLYDRIDLVFRDQGRQLAYDLALAPGADPARIRIAVEGAKSLTLAADGAMIMTLADGRELRQSAPVIYQERDGQRLPISGRFEILAATGTAPVYGFRLGAYDPSQPAIIDPVLLNYSTFVGGTGQDSVRAMVTNAQGETYVVGATESDVFPATPPPANTIMTPWDFPAPGTAQPPDGFIYKLDASGRALMFVTILAGDGDDEVRDLAIDANNNLYVTGFTDSTDFAGAAANGYPALYPVLAGGSDAFIAKLNGSGNALFFSTYYGGTKTEAGNAIALDADNNIYVAGSTDSLDLVLRGPLYASLAGGLDGFIARFTNDGLALRYATYFGGTGSDAIVALEVSPTGDLFFAGNTQSSAGMPIQHAFQSRLGGSTDMFVARIARSGSELVFSSYLGGSGADTLTDMIRDKDGNYLISGFTASANFPAVNALYATNQGGTDATLTKVDKSGRFLHFSTYFGALDDDYGNAVGEDSTADADTELHYIYLGGQTSSHFFPVQNPYQNYRAGEGDGFISKLDPCGQAIYFSTYFGGTAEDNVIDIATRPSGGTREVFIAGNTESDGNGLFPVAAAAYQTDNAGDLDTFAGRLTGVDNDRASNFDPELIVGCNPQPYPPERVCANCGGARLPLYLGDPYGIGISAFSTTIHYDPDELQFQNIAWAATLPPSATKIHDSTTPGELRLDIYQPIGAVGFDRLDYRDDLMATLEFSVIEVGTIRDNPPLPSKQIRITQGAASAADLNALDTFISGQPGAIFVERRCNGLIGDCDCSGQVQIFEIQAGVDYYTAHLPEHQPLCVKRDYSVMATTDLQEIINNYNNRVVEQSTRAQAASTSATAENSAQPLAVLDQTSRLDFGTPRVSASQIEYDLILDTLGQSIAVLATDIYYDPNLVISFDVTAQEVTQNANKQVAYAIVQAGWLRVTFYGLNATTFPSGRVATLKLTLAPGADCADVILTQQPSASTPYAEAVPIASNAAAACQPVDPGPDRAGLTWQVTEIYIATMGYAPDNQGLQYWVDRILTDPAWNRVTVAQSFFDQPLVLAQYEDMTNSQFVDQLYWNIFNRAADASAAYWVTQLDTGSLQRNQVIVAMIDGGYANPAATDDMARFANLVEVGLAFAERQEDLGLVYSQMSAERQAHLRQQGATVLVGVTKDPATRDAAIASIPFLLPN